MENKLWVASYGYHNCDPLGTVVGKSFADCERALCVSATEEAERVEGNDDEYSEDDLVFYGPFEETESFVRKQLDADCIGEFDAFLSNPAEKSFSY